MIKHLACAMDGNRRWAKKSNIPTLLGHRHGAERVKDIAEFCLEKNIPNLSLYTLSIENLQKRSPQEIEYLLALLVEKMEEWLEEFIKKNIKIVFVGDHELFPKSVQPTIKKVQEKTAHLTALTIHFLFCYGGRQEITYAAQCAAQDVVIGKLTPKNITPELIYKNLWLGGSIPEPELIIFTGRLGLLKRVSNFLLYQCAYSEIYFAECLWPDITKNDLEKALDLFKDQQRNFGQ